MMTLYHYWRSSSSWRVRWALKFKQQEVKYVPLDLLKGESETPEHLKRHPLGYVPVLEHQGRFLLETMAIIEWLEEKFPERPLFPVNSYDRAHVRALAEIINADTQPVQNLTVLDRFSSDTEERKKWSQFFIQRGFSAYEALCKSKAGEFSFGDQVTIADLYLIPQIYNALRFEINMSDFPILKAIYERALLRNDVKESRPEAFQ